MSKLQSIYTIPDAKQILTARHYDGILVLQHLLIPAYEEMVRLVYPETRKAKKGKKKRSKMKKKVKLKKKKVEGQSDSTADQRHKRQAEVMLGDAINQIRPYIDKDLYVPGVRKKCFSKIDEFNKIFLISEDYAIDVLLATIHFLINYYSQKKYQRNLKISFVKEISQLTKKYEKQVKKAVFGAKRTARSRDQSGYKRILKDKLKPRKFKEIFKRVMLVLEKETKIEILQGNSTRFPYYGLFSHAQRITKDFFKPILVAIFAFIAEYWTTKSGLDSDGENDVIDIAKLREIELEDTLMTCMALFRLDVEEGAYRPLGYLTRKMLNWSLSKDSEIKKHQLLIRKKLCSAIEMFVVWLLYKNIKIDKGKGFYRWDHLQVVKSDKVKCDHYISLFKSDEDVATLYAWAKVLSNRVFLDRYVSKGGIEKVTDDFNTPRSLFDGETPWYFVADLPTDVTVPGHVKSNIPRWVVLLSAWAKKKHKRKSALLPIERKPKGFPGWVTGMIIATKRIKQQKRRTAIEEEIQNVSWDFVPE